MSPPPIAVQPEQTWFEKAAAHGITVNRLGPETYAESGLTQAVLRGGQHRAAENLQELMDGILEVASKPGLTYAYYPKLDKTGHIYGVNSVEWRKVASKVVAMIARTRESLPANTTLVVTADHGMIDIENRVWIEDRPSLMRNIRLITGEPRLRHIFAESGSSQSLLNEWKSLEDVAEILTRDEFIATRLLGDVADFVAPRIGDVVAIAREANALASRTVDERVSNLIGQHGSRTDVEREVPLAVMAGYGRG
jgi:predicted AlkP superfamily pyrophosphatase or phosphodiesterase